MNESVNDFPEQLTSHRAALAALGASALLLDDQWRIRWVSEELRNFVSSDPEEDLGVGLHVAQAILQTPWIDVVHTTSLTSFLTDMGPYVLWELQRRGVAPSSVIPPRFMAFLDGWDAAKPPLAWRSSFSYLPPGGSEDDVYVVDVLFVRLFDQHRETGCMALFELGVPRHLVALLARGDQQMYERMARLVQPGHREAAILFCDLQGSGTLSRRLPTAEYFNLVRRLWRSVDAVVSSYGGIIGKHAGDGATAFFLADDVGGRSEATRAALLTARAIHHVGTDVFKDVAAEQCLMKVGLHWGPNLFMGQLVPGGRLDVTALGDEVNEAARIEQAAGAHETLASKQLLEGLTAAHRLELGLDTHALTYRLLAEIAPHSDKIVRDAGSLAVAVV